MTITHIDWMDSAYHEGTMAVSEGVHTVDCFFYGGADETLVRGQVLTEPLHVLDAQDIMRAEQPVPFARPLCSAESSFAVVLCGRLTDSRRQLRIGGLCFDLQYTPLPGDIQDGEWVTCVADRMDI